MADVLKTTDRTVGLSRGDLMRSRKSGTIPAIVFGKGMDSIPCFVNKVEFQQIFSAKGKIFEIEVGGKKHLVNTKFIHKDPLHKIIYQVDFHKLTKGVETTVKVPVTLTGESKGVKAGGTVSLVRDVLMVKGTPMNIPESIEIDITDLDVGESLHIKELSTTGKYTFDEDGDLTVVSVAAPKKAEEEPAADEALAGGEGEAAPAAEAAPAEGGGESAE